MRTIIEIALGLLFLVGALFNALYTYRHGEEFFGGFATSAWFRPAGKLIQRLVIPRTKLFTILLIAVQATIAFMILSRGPLVKPGLVAGAAFSLAAAFVSSVPGAIGNLALAVLLALLALTY